MNLVDINTLFPTDEKCRELLTRLRWPAGPECPRCKMPAVELETEKTLYYCKECDYQFTVTAGTIFNDSHLPLNKWFLATLLLCEAKKGMSACQIKRTLGVSYKTAWYLCHRIRAAMKEVGPMLDGTVEMDETYVGGKLRGAGKDWRGLHRTYKETVIGIRKRNGDLRFFHAEDAKTGTLAKYIQENISEDVDVVITGELPAYPRALGKLRKRHETVNHWHKEYVRRGTDIHTNTV
ncbi:MAG: IS1595 family transposase, partial [Candidatus Acidiferrales bacterium]